MGRALARIANTPRPLIQAIVQVMKPDPRGQTDFRICDPACGTGGFLVCTYEWLVSREVSGGVFDRADARRIKSQTFIGQDLVPRPRRLALMNLFLHGVEPEQPNKDLLAQREVSGVKANHCYGIQLSHLHPRSEEGAVCC